MGWATRVMAAKQARAEVRRRMEEFAKQAPEEVLTQMAASAEEITGMMKRLSSDDKELSDSVGFGPEIPKGPSGAIGSYARGVVSRKRFGKDIIYIFAGSFKAFWARWREFGTALHSLAKGASRKRGKLQDKGPHHPGEPARPFFWPTWRSYKAKVKKDMRKAYKRAAERVMPTS